MKLDIKQTLFHKESAQITKKADKEKVQQAANNETTCRAKEKELNPVT